MGTLFALMLAASAKYASMAPLEQYLIANPQEEIALARSAAPPSISADAEVRILGKHGYETAVKGRNGFVCVVFRSFAGSLQDPEFWNPKTRAPNCFNPPAMRSVWERFAKRTEWVLAGLSREEMIEKNKAFTQPPEPGAFSFMLSKQGYLGDEPAGPWYPHVMLFVPHGQAAIWAAGLEDSPVLGAEGNEHGPTVLFIPVPRWSDGSDAPALPGPHKH
jgi:hypothetical protein